MRERRAKGETRARDRDEWASLEGEGHGEVAQVREVVLDQVRVRELAEVVVVQLVVLHVPRLDEHPVEPVLAPPHDASDRELGCEALEREKERKRKEEK